MSATKTGDVLMSASSLSHQLDAVTAEIWGLRSTFGWRVDMAEVMAARRNNSGDLMYQQFVRSMSQGRVFSRLHAAGAVSGRMTMTEPNLQGLSSAYRRALLAEPGNVLIGADFDHVEPSIAALLSGDIQLLEDCRTGRDPYLEVARFIYGPIEKSDPRRKSAKTALLALLYGEGVDSLASRLSTSGVATAADLATAREIRAKVISRYPTLYSWTRQLSSAVIAGHPLLTIGGRDVSNVGIGADGSTAAYKAVNYVVQGSGADLFKRQVAVAHDLLVSAGYSQTALFLPIHDELTIEVPAERAEEGRQILEQAMNCMLSVARLGRSIPIESTAVVLGERFRKF